MSSFIDETADLGNYSYRIYGANSNQKSEYSNTATVVITSLEFAFQNDTYLYPNPAVNRVTIKVKAPIVRNANVVIRNSSGIRIEAGNVIFENNGEIHFDISSFSSDIYFVELNTAGERKIMKLVKD